MLWLPLVLFRQFLISKMKTISLFIIIGGFLIGGAIIIFGNQGNAENPPSPSVDNVKVIDGVQIIEISAKGGYLPRITSAKAGLPTIIKVETRATFDCSSAISIPSIGYRANLPPSGRTEIEIPVQEPGATLQGLCSMGMYNFKINFN